jgi:uridine kinase
MNGQDPVIGREFVIRSIADLVARDRRRPKLVGIDGVDAAGKSCFSRELVAVLAERGETGVVQVSADDFLNPPSVRYAKGRDSAAGFYRDSFNLDRIIDSVLSPHAKSRGGTLLVFDGVFLGRPELRTFWDFHLYLHCDFAESIRRGVSRDLAKGLSGAGLTSRDELATLYRNRYVEGQILYLSECSPILNASAVVDNTDLANPKVVTPRHARRALHERAIHFTD